MSKRSKMSATPLPSASISSQPALDLDLPLKLVRTELLLLQKEFALLDIKAGQLMTRLAALQNASSEAVFDAQSLSFIEPAPPAPTL